jgi:hypothetical protein
MDFALGHEPGKIALSWEVERAGPVESNGCSSLIGTCLACLGGRRPATVRQLHDGRWLHLSDEPAR